MEEAQELITTLKRENKNVWLNHLLEKKCVEEKLAAAYEEIERLKSQCDESETQRDAWKTQSDQLYDMFKKLQRDVMKAFGHVENELNT